MNRAQNVDDLEGALRFAPGEWNGEIYLPDPIKVTPTSMTEWSGGWNPQGDEGNPDADESKPAADQRIPDADERNTITVVNPYAKCNSTKADHRISVAKHDCTTYKEDVEDECSVKIDYAPQLRTDGSPNLCFDYETQTRGKIIHGDQRRGSGKKRPSGRFGQRGGTRNPNVVWHCMKAQAQREGWIEYFRETCPKPTKVSQWSHWEYMDG